MTPREIIDAEYGLNSRNLFTPHRLGIGRLPDGAYELSYSPTSMSGNTPIWAVAVVRVREDGTTYRDTEACAVFHSGGAAHAYIRSLKAVHSKK